MTDYGTSAPARASGQISSPMEPPGVTHTDVTDSTIRLVVRPAGTKYLNAGLAPSAQFAGFVFIDAGKPHAGSLGIVDSDTSVPYAVIVSPNGFKAAVGELTDITIIIDPMAGPWEWQAGDRIVAACVKFATAMHGELFHADGTLVTGTEATAISQKIETAMQARRDSAKPERVKLDDGTWRKAGTLSFHCSITTPRGRWIEQRYFDAPPMPHDEGNILGFEMARELLQYAKAHKKANKWELIRSIIDAVRHPDSGDMLSTYDRASVGNVADGFMKCLMEMVFFAARHCEFDRWIDGRVADLQADADRYVEREARQKTEFVERMRVARAAKKAGAA